MPSPTGFEARPRHRARLPSLKSVICLLGQGVVETEMALVAKPSRQADPVEVFENLDAALATQAHGITKRRDLNHRVLRGQLHKHSRQPAHYRIGVKQVTDDLMQQSQPRHFAQQHAHRHFIMAEVAHPRRIETRLFEQWLQLLPQHFVVFAQTHLMVRQMQPRPAGSDGATGQSFVEQADKRRPVQ